MSENQLPAKINDESFGELINLPRLFEEGQERVQKAKMAADYFMKPFNDVKNIAEIEMEAMELIMVNVRKVRGNLATLYDDLQAKRMPLTRKMDEIKGTMITLEKTVEDLVYDTKKAEDNWQIELRRRDKVKKDAAQKILDDEKIKIAGVASVVKQINEQYINFVALTLSGMTKKFADQTVDTLAVFVDGLKKWAPVALFDLAKMPGLSLDGQLEWIGQAMLDTKESLAADFKMRIKEAVDKLVDMVPGRIHELQTQIEPTTTFDLVGDVTSLVDTMNTVVDEAASQKSMNATFNNVAATLLAAPSAGLRGAKQKKKYVVTTHEGMQLIIQSWVANNFKLMTMDELNTKLSFMRTAANVRLNDGTQVLAGKGIEVVDDISTRTQKTS